MAPEIVRYDSVDRLSPLRNTGTGVLIIHCLPPNLRSHTLTFRPEGGERTKSATRNNCDSTRVIESDLITRVYKNDDK